MSVPRHQLCYLVSHPIQYQAALLRQISKLSDIDLTVLFENDESTGRYHDRGFQRTVEWDIPLTEGYKYSVVTSASELASQLCRYDVLWIHGWNSSIRRKALSIANSAGIPVLMRGENTLTAMPDGLMLRGIIKRYYLKRLFRNCSGFLCIGSNNRDYYKNHGIEDTQLFSMLYSVDNAFFDAQSRAAALRRDAFRQELGLKPNRPVILFAGKLLRRKRPLELLQAWRKFNQNSTQQSYLLFVGDGEERAALDKATYGEEGVRMLGFKNQQELPAFYDLADVFVLASRREPWGLAVNEAMACGTAVIASEECGCSADLIDDSCGKVVPVDDPKGLVDALSYILCDPRRTVKMGETARKRISHWSFDQNIEGLRTAIRKVCPKPGKA
ncbi:MAG: glycosyltransferase [Magnetovibrio sp.]|nr:glycosyltransferase [Magnetovibrio sp.]